MLEKLKDKMPYIISLIFVCGVLFWVIGCTPKTRSLINPDARVDRSGLLAEIEYLNKQYANAIKALDKQEEFRNIVLQQTFKIAQTGSVNPLGVIASIMAIMGLGAGADNVRLRKQRKYDHENHRTGKTDKLCNDSSPSEQSGDC